MADLSKLSSSTPLELSSKVPAMPVPALAEALPPPKPADQQGVMAWIIEKAFDVAILVTAVANLLFVFFDYSYVMLRPHYQHHAPGVVAWYDPQKGIDPDRQTTAFLAAARDAWPLLQQDPASQASQAALAGLQAAGTEIMKSDPFKSTNQSGVLQRIKRLTSSHMARRAPVVLAASGLPTVEAARRDFMDHSTKALALFWTPSNLSLQDVAGERAWFEHDLAPLFNRAYYRHIDEEGKPVEQFWRIDLAFASVFALELLLRFVWVLGFMRQQKPFKQAFQELAASRWMDFLYFLPLVLYLPIIGDLLPPFIRDPLQLVRMFSVGFRMQRLGLINPVEVAQAKMAELMDHITNMVNVKLLSNYQASIQDMDMAEAMRALTPQQREQLTVLIQRNLTMVLRDVLPDVAPQIEKLVMRAAQTAMEQAPAYQQLKRFPLFGALPERMLPNLVGEVLAGTQVTMLKAINDTENVKLTNALIDGLTDSLITHMAEVGTETEIKKLLVDMLEEQKHKVLAG